MSPQPATLDRVIGHLRKQARTLRTELPRAYGNHRTLVELELGAVLKRLRDLSGQEVTH